MVAIVQRWGSVLSESTSPGCVSILMAPSVVPVPFPTFRRYWALYPSNSRFRRSASNYHRQWVTTGIGAFSGCNESECRIHWQTAQSIVELQLSAWLESRGKIQIIH